MCDNETMKCPICHTESEAFLEFGVDKRQNAMCPHCNSLERHRAVWLLIREFLEEKSEEVNVLHFSPERSIINRLSNMDNINYYPVDLDHNRNDIRYVVDITRIPFHDSSFDMVICNHVLQEVKSDYLALNEVYRVLADDGISYFTLPVYESRTRTLEDSRFNTPELRKKNYGSENNRRKYGIDAVKRLSSSGFDVEIIKCGNYFSEEEIRRHGLLSSCEVYMCRK